MDGIDIAVADAPRDAEIRHIGSIKGDLASLDKAIRKLVSRGQPLQIAYEAGPCGFVIQRHLCAQGLHCEVVAPSSIARPPGERIKTDRRDALAYQHDQPSRIHIGWQFRLRRVPRPATGSSQYLHRRGPGLAA